MRILASLLLLATCLSARADLDDPSFLEKLKPVTGGSVLAWEEQYEGAGYQNAPAATGGTTAPDPDYATSPAPLLGSHSLRLSDGGTDPFVSNNIPSASAFSYAFDFNYPSVIPAGTHDGPIYFYNSSGVVVMKLRMDGDGTAGGSRFIYFHGTSFSNGTGGEIAAATTTRVWIDWAKGTGANGTLSVYVGPPGARPGSPTKTFATGQASTDVASVVRYKETQSIIIDNERYRIDGSPITD